MEKCQSRKESKTIKTRQVCEGTNMMEGQKLTPSSELRNLGRQFIKTDQCSRNAVLGDRGGE